MLTAGLVRAAGSELTLGDGTYTDAAAYANATKIVKTGTGTTTLSFGNATSSFKGEIEVRAGTLAVEANPGNFGKPTKITVLSGATLDLSWNSSSYKDQYFVKNAELVIAGTGVDNGGAIRRVSGGNYNDLFTKVTLTADALIHTAPQIGFVYGAASTLNLNGHTLTVRGTAVTSSIFYCPNVKFQNNGSTADPGHLVFDKALFFPRYDAQMGGSEANVLTLKNGARVRFREWRIPSVWKMVTEGPALLTADSASTTTNTWAGPVELTDKLTLFPQEAGTLFRVSGPISNAQPIEMESSSLGTAALSGSNDVSTVTVRGGTLRVDGGQTTVHGAVQVLTGGALAVSNAVLFTDYAKMTAFEIGHANGAKLIVGPDGRLIGHNFGGSNGAATRLYVARHAGHRGTMEVHEGAVVSNVLVNVGEAGTGAFYQTGGSVYWPARNSDAVANTAGAYGYYGLGGTFTLDAGDFSLNQVIALARTGTVVMAVRPGGALNVDGSKYVAWAQCDGAQFVYYQDSGAVSTFDEHFLCGTTNSVPRRFELTVSGEGSELLIQNTMKLNFGGADAPVAINVNDGAALALRSLYRLGDYPWYFNLNGGIIKPRRQNKVFTDVDDAWHRPTRTTVYEGGLTIDTSETMNEDRTEYGTADMCLSFEAPPAGKRVASIAWPMDAEFAAEEIIGSPVVAISGDGAGATAFARFNEATHALDDLVVTSPGWGYTTATATLSGGGLSREYTCAVTLADPPETGWRGFTKRGAQRLNLFGAHTFKGGVTVEEGTLGFMSTNAVQGGLPVGAAVTLKENTILTFRFGNTPVTVSSLAGCGKTSYGTITVTDRIECTAAEIFAGKHLTVDQNLTLEDGVTITVTDPENLTAYRENGLAIVVETPKDNKQITVKGRVTLEFAGASEEDPARWQLSVGTKAIRFGYMSGTVLIVR